MEIGASPSAVFGNLSANSIFGSPSAESVFAAGSSGSDQAGEIALVTIEAHRREINRIRGYKLQLTVPEKQQLAQIQVEVQEIQQRISSGTARDDELDDRKELLAEADRIIGKPTVDVEADQTLADLAGAIQTLLQPKLDPQKAKTVERLERIKDNLEAKLTANPESKTLLAQFQSAFKVLSDLAPLRDVKSLSQAEQRAYDLAVEAVNEHVGVKIELTAKEAIRVAELDASISQLQSLVPDTTGQPTASAVAQAYVRLAL